MDSQRELRITAMQMDAINHILEKINNRLHQLPEYKRVYECEYCIHHIDEEKLDCVGIDLLQHHLGRQDIAVQKQQNGSLCKVQNCSRGRVELVRGRLYQIDEHMPVLPRRHRRISIIAKSAYADLEQSFENSGTHETYETNVFVDPSRNEHTVLRKMMKLLTPNIKRAERRHTTRYGARWWKLAQH